MSRTPGDGVGLAPQTQGGVGTLDKNGSGAGVPPSGPAARAARRSSPFRTLLVPLLAAAVCGGGAFVVSSRYMTHWYTSATTIWFPAAGNQGSANFLNSLIGGATDPTGSVPILGGLYNSPQFGAGPSTAITALDSGRAKGQVMQTLNLPAHWHLPPDQAGARFNKNVTYGVDKNGLLMIQATDTDPRFAQRLVNTYVEAMRQVSTEMSTSLAHKNLVVVRDRYADAHDKLLQDEKDLVALQKRTTQAIPLGSAANAAYVDLTGQQTATRAELSATNAELAAQVQTARKTYGSSLALPESQPFAQSTIQALRKAESDFAAVRAVYGPEYPGYREAEGRVAQARSQAQAELERQYAASTKLISPDTAGLYVKQRSLQARLDYLDQAAAARKADVLSLPEAQMRAADLSRRIAQDSTLESTLQQAVTQAELAEKRDVPNFEVMDAAGVPAEPSLPRVGYTTALASVAGFLLALAWLTARALLSHPMGQAGLRRWTDEYGLTEREDAPAALEAPRPSVLGERSAPQLPHATEFPHAADAVRSEEAARLRESEGGAGRRQP